MLFRWEDRETEILEFNAAFVSCGMYCGKNNGGQANVSDTFPKEMCCCCFFVTSNLDSFHSDRLPVFLPAYSEVVALIDFLAFPISVHDPQKAVQPGPACTCLTFVHLLGTFVCLVIF